MAGTSLLALIDDIASVLDDVSVLTKVAAKKTAGVLGDDLALNAEQVTGVETRRELPVVWAVAKGSFVNKLILVPAALGISAIAPWAVTPLLMVGGAFLCFEGVEKVAHKLLHKGDDAKAEKAAHLAALADASVDLVALEKEKIKGAIRTDFILSAEIVAITLGAVATEPLGIRVAVLSAIALLMTVGVYGLVAGIVKLDDLGLHLQRKGARRLGGAVLGGAVWLMKALSVAGTAAMLLVGGGILTHGIPRLDHFIQGHGQDGLFGAAIETLADLAVGFVAGVVAVALVQVVVRVRDAVRGKRSGASAH